MTKSRACWLLIASLALPAGLVLALVLRFGVNHAFADEWDPGIIGYFIKLLDHRLTVWDLVHRHGEHRILFPRLIYYALALATGWDTRAGMIAGWFIVVATSIGVLRLAQQTQRESSTEYPLGFQPRTIFLWFVSNLVIFTPSAWENWLWGICNLVNTMAMAFIVWMLVVLNSRMRGRRRLIVAVVLAATAQYSSGNGVLAWPLGALVMIWPLHASHRAERKRALIVWTGACLLFTGLYFIGYQQAAPPGADPYASTLWQKLAYFIVFLGTPFAFTGVLSLVTTTAACGSAMLIGLLIIMLQFLSIWRAQRDDQTAARMIVWIAVAGFSVLNGLLGAISRAGLGVDQAINSTRYVTFALYLPLGIIQLLAILQERSVAPGTPRPILLRRSLAPALIVLLLLQSLTYRAALRDMRTTQIQRRQGKAFVQLIQIAPDNPILPMMTFPNVRIVKDEAQILSDRGYLHPPLVTSADAMKIAETDRSRIDSVAGAIERLAPTEGGYITATGWAAFTTRSSPADAVFLTYESAGNPPTIFAVAPIRTRRPEIARFLGDDGLADTGWVAEFSLGMLPQDVPSVTLSAWALDAETGRAIRLHGGMAIDPKIGQVPR